MILRKLYDWVLNWAYSLYAVPALFILAFSESSFFPIPPDILLIALAVSLPKRSFYYSSVTTVGSVIGGMFGYFLGWQFMELIGIYILNIYGLMDKFVIVQDYYRTYDAWAVGTAGFTPLPYKLFTITAGATQIDFVVFVLASTISRGARFFIIGALIYKFGPWIKYYLDKYFNILSIIFIILLIGGFILIKLIF